MGASEASGQSLSCVTSDPGDFVAFPIPGTWAPVSDPAAAARLSLFGRVVPDRAMRTGLRVDRVRSLCMLRLASMPLPGQDDNRRGCTMAARAILTSTVLAAALVAGQAFAGEVRVLNWQGYGTDEPWGLEMFEAATGHTVVHDHFNSEQEMMTKLRTSPGAYDVVLINSAFTLQGRRGGPAAARRQRDDLQFRRSLARTSGRFGIHP